MADNKVYLRKSGTGDIVASTATIADTTNWHYVVATKNGATVKLYVDGVDVTGTVTNQTIASNTQPLRIGKDGPNSAWFYGSIDDAAVYGTALSAARVQAHYEAGRAYREEVPATSPVSWWRLSETGTSITHRASSSAARTTNSTTLVINKPAGVVQGDVMIAAFQESGGITGTVTPPAGWTLIRSQTVESNTKTYTYWKAAGASEPASYTWTSTLSSKHSGGIIAMTGVDTTTPVDASASVENTANLSVSCPAVTTTVDYGWLVTVAITHDGTTFTFPSGQTERFDVSTGNTSTTDRTTAGATEPLGTAGSTGARTVTNDNPFGFAAPTTDCFSIALRPALGAGYDAQHANDGTFSGGTTLHTAGGIAGDDDSSARFDGSTGTLTVPDSNSLDLGDGPLTLEAWIKRGSTADSSILEKNTSYELWITGNRLALRKAGVADVVQSTTTITDTTTWHHVVATKNGATSKLYIDGADVTGTITNQTLVDSTTVLTISGNPIFNGFLDEVAIYNTVLTPAQVLAHYLAGRG
jgi:hypothetical protein